MLRHDQHTAIAGEKIHEIRFLGLWTLSIDMPRLKMKISLKTMLLDVYIKACYMKKITSMIAYFAAIAKYNLVCKNCNFKV